MSSEAVSSGTVSRVSGKRPALSRSCRTVVGTWEYPLRSSSVTGVSSMPRIARITSYNVCYMKLLRKFGERTPMSAMRMRA